MCFSLHCSTTRTMSLQEEKNIIRKMDDLKRMKPKIRAYKAGEEELAVRYKSELKSKPDGSFTATFLYL